MGVNLKLLDHIQLNGRIHNTIFGCQLSEDGKIFLLLDGGVSILTLKGSLESISGKFSFKKDFITLSQTSISDYIDLELSSFINNLEKEEFYEGVLDVALSGNTLPTSATAPKPVYAEWSPRGIIEKTEGALAVLTNLHNLEIYVEVCDENEITSFTRVANFAKDATMAFRPTWKKPDGLSPKEKFADLKKRVGSLTPTVFTWSHVILKDRKTCCILFVAHKTGQITAWRFVERKTNEMNESKLHLLDTYQTEFGEITSLTWFCTNSDEGGLAIGDISGKIGALSVSKLSTDNIRFENEMFFYTKNDLKVDRILVFDHKNVTYIVAVKRNFLHIYVINEYAEAVSGKIIQVGNLFITGVLHYENNILLVLSFCGELKEIALSLTTKIEVEERLIHAIDRTKYRTHGFVLSKNKVFLGILAYPCQLKDISRGKNFVNFFLFGNAIKKPLELLMNSSASNLRDSWDCFETLRVWCVHEKKFPWEGIDRDLNYDTLPLVKLKVLRWIAKLSERIYPSIPRVEEYHIKPYVMLNYAVEIKLAVGRITKLLNIYFSEKKLSLFQMQSLDLLNFFLKEMVLKDILAKSNLGETFIDEIYAVMRVANELEYPPMPQCYWCGERIIGPSCVPNHPDSRCSISLMPICILPGFRCPFCSCVVHKELEKEYVPIFCPYCDVPMKRRNYEKKSEPEEVYISDCYPDCLKEDLQNSDLEENETEYLVLTDSDEEHEESLREIYHKIKKIAITSAIHETEDTIIISNAETSNSQSPKKRKSTEEDDEEEEEDSYSFEDSD